MKIYLKFWVGVAFLIKFIYALVLYDVTASSQILYFMLSVFFIVLDVNKMLTSNEIVI